MSEDLLLAFSKISGAYSACTCCADLGIPPDPKRATFAALARASLPAKVRVLFIAESAPTRNKRGRYSYFYLPEDNPKTQDPSALFWELAKTLDLAAACGTEYRVARGDTRTWKPRLLAEFSARGLWLVDSAKCAVNGVKEGKRRDTALARCAYMWLQQELAVLEPDRIVLVKTNVFRVLRPLLESWGFGPRVMNQAPIPHPGSGHQKEFREAVGAIVRANQKLFGA